MEDCLRTFMQSSRGFEGQGLCSSGLEEQHCLRPWPSGQEGRPCKYLVDMVQFKVLEQQQQDSRNGLNNDLFVAVHIHPQLHALQHCGAGNTITWMSQQYVPHLLSSCLRERRDSRAFSVQRLPPHQPPMDTRLGPGCLHPLPKQSDSAQFISSL